jgi:glycosyltransferase involved in cell wall biosynthesis
MINTVVLIPHYNNLECLERTLESIYHAKGIDVLVVDDGSDGCMLPSFEMLQKVLNANVHLELIKLNKNEGITHALNVGLDHILINKKHHFIARIDCGDLCVYNRFERQENFLINNNDIALVGSWVKWVDGKGEVVFCKKPPINHKEIQRRMSVRCSLIHPSTMFRYSVVEELGKYPEEYEAAEDYAYFYKIINQYRVANIPEFLTTVEYTDDGISSTKRKEQNRSKLKIICAYSPVNFLFIYGMIFNLVLMTIGSSTILKIKKKVFNDNSTRS